MWEVQEGLGRCRAQASGACLQEVIHLQGTKEVLSKGRAVHRGLTPSWRKGFPSLASRDFCQAPA